MIRSRTAFGAVVLAAVLASALPTSANGDVARPAAVLAPGQSGVAASGHDDDQLELFRAWRRREMRLRPPVESTSITVRPGAQVARDLAYGAPYVSGSTLADVAFAAGYAVAEDRFFAADVLRHQAEGRLAEFRGADALPGDVLNRRAAPTDDDLLRAFSALPERERQVLTEYAAGMNAWLAKARAANALPTQYQTLGPPGEWRVLDSLHIAHFLARSLAAGGRELRNARLLRRLRRIHGQVAGDRYFDDALFRADAGTPTTLRGSITRSGGASGPTGAGAAIPDTDPVFIDPVRETGPYAIADAIGSGAVAISPKAAARNLTLLFAMTDAGYSTPAALLELSLDGGGLLARGATLPGLGPFLLTGRTDKHAWSLTTSRVDQVDTFAEFADPADLTRYRYQGALRPFDRRVETLYRGPSATGALVPVRELVIRRSVHGVVIARGKVGGRPVFFTRSRAGEGRELSLLQPLLELAGSGTYAALEPTLANVAPAAGLVYAERGRIAFVQLGSFPLRRQGTDDRLPVRGTGPFDHLGVLNGARSPRIVNPTRGILVAWGNRPIAGWSNGDSSNFSTTHRATRLIALLGASGRITRAELESAVRGSAEFDARVPIFRKRIIDAVDQVDDPVVQDAVAALRNWDGRRVDANGDGTYDAPGVAIMDAWWAEMRIRLLQPVFGPKGVKLLGPAFDPGFGGGDAAGLIDHILRGSASTVATVGSWPSTRRTRRLVGRTFILAVRGQRAKFNTDDVDRWLAPRATQQFRSIDGTAAPVLTYANRGAYEMAVEIER